MGRKREREKKKKRRRRRRREREKVENVNLNNKQSKLASKQAGYTKSFFPFVVSVLFSPLSIYSFRFYRKEAL
jgi:hypothetical protein